MVFDEFHSSHAAKSAHIANQGIMFLHIQKAFCDNMAYFAGAGGVVLLLEEIEYGQRCCTGDWIAAVSPPKCSRWWCVHDFGTSDHTTYRHTSTHGFCDNHEIRFYTIVFNREHSTCAAKTRLNFICDEKDMMFFTDFFEGA